MEHKGHKAVIATNYGKNCWRTARYAVGVWMAWLFLWAATSQMPAAEPSAASRALALPKETTASTVASLLSGPILPALESLDTALPSTATAASPTDRSDQEHSLLKGRFQQVLWERLRAPVFLFVLGSVFLVLLLFSLYGRRPTRWRSLTARSLILSIIVHTVILLCFGSVVLSQRVVQTIREPGFEVLVDSDNLAREKVSLEIREETAELPLADTAVAVGPQASDVPLPKAAPVKETPTLVPGRVDLKAFELPTDIAKPKPREEERPEAPLAARPTTEFRIVTPQVALETPKPPTSPEPSEKETPRPRVSPEMVERPIAVATLSEIEKTIAGGTKGPPVAPGTPLPVSVADLPALAAAHPGEPAEPTVPQNLLALRPPPKPLPAPIILEERPASQQPYRLRKPEQRAGALELLGGSPETEKAVRQALQWLAAHQSDDGRWAVKDFDVKCGKCGGQGDFGKQDMAATALATLAFLGAGHTHKDKGPYRQTVARAIAWLVAQARKDGDLRGQGNMYDQGMATIALAEACGMTRDASLGPVVEQACKFIASAQNAETGGWRYFPGEEGDTSVFGWQVMALKSASMAGVPIPEKALLLAERWLERVGGGQNGGLYGYQDKNPRPSMAAEGMFARQLLGHPPTEAAMMETADYLRKYLPTNSDPNMYYWYYGTLALFQHQGRVWEEWNRAMRKVLLSSQNTDGTRNGSWAPRGQWSQQGGRIVETAMATLSLEVYYRYLPLYTTLATKAVPKSPPRAGSPTKLK